MSEDNENQQDSKKQETFDNSKKAVDTAGKAASTYFTGSSDAYNTAKKIPGVNGAVDGLANSVSKAAEKNPALEKALNKAGNSGALNAANGAMDANSALGKSGGLSSDNGMGKTSEFGKKSALSDSNSEKEESNSNASSTSDSSSSEEESGSSDFASKLTGFLKKNMLAIIISIVSMFFIILVFLVLIGSIYGVLDNISSFVKGVWNTFATGIETQSAEEKYYEKLVEVQGKLEDKYGVCIDINLITATLIVEQEMDDTLVQGEELADASESDTEQLEYNKMIKEIELLGNYQIKRQYYSYPENRESCYYEGATNICVEGGVDVKATAENVSCGSVYTANAVASGFFRDSSNNQLISRNDKTSFGSFFTKKANEEKNYEYYLTYPDYTVENGVVTCNVPNNELGSAKEDGTGNEFATLDIENTADSKSVYYWNIVESFIADYYDKYAPNDSIDENGYPTGERLEFAKKIADRIYLLWNESGPSQNCGASKFCRSDGEAAQTYVSESRQSCYDTFADYVVDDMSRTGVLASVTLAQLCIESGNGGSNLSVKYSNYFGMTAGSSWTGETVDMCNKSGVDCQSYRVYDSLESSISDHSRLLSNSRYALQGITDYKTAIAKLVDGGYATDEKYASTLIGQIETYDLTQYDIGEWDGATASAISYNYTQCTNTYGTGTATNGNFVGGNVCTASNNVNDTGGFWSRYNKFASPQCTWYAFGRGLQILTDAGMPIKDALANFSTIYGDAGEWFGQNTKFDTSTDVNAPKIGSLLIWDQPGYYGHVAVVEKIYYDDNGNVLSLDISEGNVSMANGTKARCYERNVSIDYVAKHKGGSSRNGAPYIFVGYIYLLK